MMDHLFGGVTVRCRVEALQADCSAGQRVEDKIAFDVLDDELD